MLNQSRRDPHGRCPGCTPVAALATAILTISVALWSFTYRGLYADGALYLLHLLTTDGFFHVSPNRISSTFITQAPLVLARQLGATSLQWLAALHTLSLAIVPAGAYAAALWLARCDRWLFAGSVTVLSVVFYPSSFAIIGEFHVLYALFWLGWVLLLSGAADRKPGAALLLLISFAVLRSYEISVLLGPLLAALATLRSVRTGAPRWLLRAAVLVFLIGAVFGLQGVIHPHDAGNEQNFAAALRNLPSNRPVLFLSALSLTVTLAGFVRDRWMRVAIGTALAAMTALFMFKRAVAAHDLGLGPPADARAQVVPILIAIALLCLVLWQCGHARTWQPWFLILPLIAAFSIDAADTFGWHRFLGSMCGELAARAQGRTDNEFVHHDLARTYGWVWTYPTMSVLLAPADSTAMIINPDHHGWEPDDTLERGVALARFKRDGGLCGR